MTDGKFWEGWKEQSGMGTQGKGVYLCVATARRTW